MQQGNIVNNMLEIVMQDRFTIKHQHKGFIAMGIDIRRRMSKLVHILQSCAV